MIVADILDIDWGPLLDGVDVVFHLAAVPGVRESWGNRGADYAAVNVWGTQRLLDACHVAGVPRLVHASSSSVYGPSSGSRMSREGDAPLPASPYGVTKLAAEAVALAYARRSDAVTRVAVMRYFSVYGPRQRADLLFARILGAALTGRAVPLYGDGSQRRDFTYVGDAVAATIAAAELDVPEAVINVAGGRSVSLREAIDVARVVTGRQILVKCVGDRVGDIPATWADLGAARRLLGYMPQVDLRGGMTRQWAWLRALGDNDATAFLDRAELQEVS